MVIKIFSSNLCATCSDCISDPVCRKCYIKQVSILLNDFGLPEIGNKIVLDKIKKKFPIENLNETKCILCREQNVILCRYCFSLLLTGILREMNFTEDLIEQFGFNYQENY